MIAVISPAKTLDFKTSVSVDEYSIPLFLTESNQLVQILRSYKPIDIASLMGVSAKLADLNFERFLKWNKNHNPNNSKQAIFAFNGDVYEGIDAKSLSQESLQFLNANVRILSGLYGVLKPFDLMMEYRLEMGTKLENTKGPDLYHFWGKKIAKELNQAISGSVGEKVLINLASNEYFKSVDLKTLQFQVITPVFKEYKDGSFQIISFFAKKARGLMTRFISNEQITEPEQIKYFNLERYAFNDELSDKNQWVFTR